MAESPAESPTESPAPSSVEGQPKKRVKWEPPALMVAVLIFGVWLVTALGTHPGLPEMRDGAITAPLQIGAARGALEIVPAGEEITYRVLYRDGSASAVMDRQEITAIVPEAQLANIEALTIEQGPFARGAFRVFNITGWGSLVWVAIGLAGQVAFFGRMAIQWVLSERRRESVVPAAFWWLSLFGGVFLFTYFVWRQDVIGVLGQSTGVVIYARNLRLIKKQRRREARRAQEARREAEIQACDPSPERRLG